MGNFVHSGGQQKVVVIGLQWPEPNATAAGKRMLQLLDFFAQKGFAIHFYATAVNPEAQEELEKRGFATQKGEANSKHFDDWLADIEPQIVLFDRFVAEEQFGWRVHEICPEAIKILDLEDFHALRFARQTELKSGVDVRQIMRSSDVAKREIAAMYRCDCSLVISLAEMRLFTELFGLKPEQLQYVPLLSNRTLPRTTPSFHERRNFVSVGNFLHAPNADAVRRLKTTIWPKIRSELPHAQLFIYGAYLPEAFRQMHKPAQGFHVLGYAGNLQTVLENARVLLAPLRFGAGQKGKLFDAMENGLPNVTTKVGAEGLQLGLDWSGYVATDEQDFVDKAIKLYTKEELWNTAQKQGYAMLRNFFDADIHLAELEKKLTNSQINLNEIRQQNFIGSMLQHHHMRSTKYLAKWIEEKQNSQNKKSHS